MTGLTGVAARTGARPRAAAVVADADPGVLARVTRPGVAAAIWQRTLDPALMRWLEATPPQNLPRCRMALPVGDVGRAADAACGIAGLPPSPERAALAADAQDLARRFAAIMAAPAVALRLEAVTTNACRRFHVDHMPARLLCTYRGQATQYGVPGPQGEVAAPAALATGWVGLFRGSLWPGEETALLHRSPPIEGSGETRLLLVLDVVGPDASDHGHC
ncbi:MAG: DUF1826 domain-containing protein [Gemmobacter sp.]